jgi:hypothetical protein
MVALHVSVSLRCGPPRIVHVNPQELNAQTQRDRSTTTRRSAASPNWVMIALPALD